MIALGRRNWLFIGSQLAGERAAVVMPLRGCSLPQHRWLCSIIGRPRSLCRFAATRRGMVHDKQHLRLNRSVAQLHRCQRCVPHANALCFRKRRVHVISVDLTAQA